MRADTISSLCPEAYRAFVNYLETRNENVRDFFMMHFHKQVGIFFHFFKEENTKYECDKIRITLVEFHLMEHVDFQVNDICKMFISLEAKLRQVPAW